MSLSFHSCQTVAVDDDVLVFSMISHRVPIDDMAKLYVAFDKREAGVKKVCVLTLWFWCDGSGVTLADGWISYRSL